MIVFLQGIFLFLEPIVTNPCNPSPCGPNSRCQEVNQQAVCTCVENFTGSPPSCRPECLINSDCQLNRACINQKCADPCLGSCGVSANCQVVNHNPICSCPAIFTGDPFVRCIARGNYKFTQFNFHCFHLNVESNFSLIQKIVEEPVVPTDPCSQTPCGPNAICQVRNNAPSCSCQDGFIGQPPNCRPECIVNSECDNQLACINRKCVNPCEGSCGTNAECRVTNHIAICTCMNGFSGDPFVQCSIQPSKSPFFKTNFEKICRIDFITGTFFVAAVELPRQPCQPSPCGSNAVCNEQNGVAVCKCLSEYVGNPYESCRPECTINSDCSTNMACIRSKCQNPCLGTCGFNADCQVVQHLPICTCTAGYTGDPFVNCNLMPRERKLFINSS